MAQKRTPGLYRKNGIWWVDKVIRGHRIRCSTSSRDLTEAQRFLDHQIAELRNRLIYGERPRMTFQQAAERYLEHDCPPKSLERCIVCLSNVSRSVGDLYLDQVHDDNLAQYKAERLRKVTPGTVNRELAVVRRVLNLAARVWRDELSGKTLLAQAPLIRLVKDTTKRDPYPITQDEQRNLLRELPDHLAVMALFAVNTGMRQEEICGLRWDWVQHVPELGCPVIVLAATETKTNKARVVVLNTVARGILEDLRGSNQEYVFTYQGHRVGRINNHAWRKARDRADLPRVRVHDLRHTFGQRLRAAGVSLEDREDLLGHESGRMTTHYSAPELGRLLEAAESVALTTRTTILRVVPTKIPTSEDSVKEPSAVGQEKW